MKFDIVCRKNVTCRTALLNSAADLTVLNDDGVRDDSLLHLGLGLRVYVMKIEFGIYDRL